MRCRASKGDDESSTEEPRKGGFIKRIGDKLYEGTTSRLFNTDTYEPKTARARRAGVCPRCDAVVPREQPPHKSGWCTACQKKYALVDFSDGF